MDQQLVDREPERAQLQAWAAAARAGRGSLVLLAGEAGVGKTALARQVLGGAGLAVLEGVAAEVGTLAYGPVVAALRSQIRSGGGLPVEGPLARHLALLLPELGPAADTADQATLFEAVRAALAGIAARRPAAVFLDDLHQADDATLGLLGALARAIEDQPLLIVGAYRSDELSRAHPIRRLRGELRRAHRLRELLVGPLDGEAGAALLERALGARAAPSLRRAVAGRTDGVPFFVEELGLALAASGWLQPGPAGLELLDGKDLPLPDSVRDAVLLRAAGLSERARAAVEAASVAGLSFDPELVAAIAELGEWPDELVRRGVVLEVEPGRMAFRHALVRDAFYGEVPWSRRVGLHRAVARRLAADGAPPALVAEQWAKGREPDRARQAFLAAAEAFCAVHAYRDGARATARALDLWPEGRDEPGRLAALERLAGCQELAGDLAEAITTWREVVEGCAWPAIRAASAAPTGGWQARWSCRAGGRRRWPRGSEPRPPSPPRLPRRMPPRNGWPPRRTCGRRPASRPRCTCCGSPGRKPGRPAASTWRRGPSRWRATSAPAWATAPRGSSWSAPA